MNFLAIVVALGLERMLAPWRDAFVRPARALRAYVDWPGVWRSRAGVIALIGVPTALVTALQVLASRVPLAETALGTIVLFACLGPSDLALDLRRLSRAMREDDRAEQARLWQVLNASPEPDAARATVLGSLFIRSHETLFGVLLWFALAGPAGATFYRLASRFPHVLSPADGPGYRAGFFVHGVAAYVPTRVTCALFALAGSMDAALAAWRRVPRSSAPALQRGWVLLAQSASAASAMEPEDHLLEHARLDEAVREVLRMQRRALLLALALYALLVAGLWIG